MCTFGSTNRIIAANRDNSSRQFVSCYLHAVCIDSGFLDCGDEHACEEEIMTIHARLKRSLVTASCLFVFLGVMTGQTQSQSPVTKAAKSPSSALINQLTQQLSITPKQAAGGAGTLFGVAKSNLSPENFNKIAAVVPGMNGLLKAAPSTASPAGGVPGLSNALPGKAEAWRQL